MFDKALIALAIASLLFVGYLMVKAYRPQWFQILEKFDSNKRNPVPPIQRVAAIPAPAPPILSDPVEPERTVAPAGPNAPNARAPPAPARISPEAVPTDPYDSGHMEAPIKDTLTHPELSFGPGVDNTATAKKVEAGLASAAVSAPVSSFSPEFAQNGGSFMGSVFANDLQPGDDFAMA